MGKLSNVFRNVGNGITGKGRDGYFGIANKWNRYTKKKGGYAGGYGAWTFSNIMNAHCSVDDIIQEFGLNKEDCPYCDAYATAFKEQYDIALYNYRETVEYYLSLIDIATGEMNLCLEEAELLEQEAQELQEKAEQLWQDAQDAMDMGDFDSCAELMEEAEILEQEAQVLLEQAQALRQRALELQLLIDNYYSTIDFLNLEDFIDWDEIEKNAYAYAEEYAQRLYDGSCWIPPEILQWGYYTISSHNG